MPTPSPPPLALRWEWVLALTGAAVAARLAVVLLCDGILYPDEVFQSLEPAHRLARGSGLIAWEWEAGARHPLLAWLLSLVMHGGSSQLNARALLAVASGAATWPVVALSRNLGATPRNALVAGALYALGSWGVLLGPRGLSESAALLPLTACLAFLTLPSARPLAAALAFSVAVMLRLQCGLFVVSLAAWAVLANGRGRWRLLLGLGLGAAVFGALDAWQWGSPFHSAVAYLRFNLLEGRARDFGVEGWAYYPRGVALSLGGVGAALLVGLRARGAGARVVALGALGFLLAHEAQPHKELRFVLPALPALVALAGAGLPERAGWWRPAALALALLTQPMPWTLSFRQLGIPLEPRAGPAWDDGGSYNRLLVQAGRRPEVCGVRLVGRELGYSGGYAWFEGAAPLFDARQPAADPAQWNALIAPGPGTEGTLLATDGTVELRLVRPGCLAGPFDPHLR